MVYLVEHGLDLEQAISYLVRECADHPKMQASKDQRKLARNILTIGGIGAEKMLNLQAWRDAIDLIEVEEHRKQVSGLQKQIDDKDTKIRELEQDFRSLNRDYRNLVALQASPQAPVMEAEPITG